MHKMMLKNISIIVVSILAINIFTINPILYAQQFGNWMAWKGSNNFNLNVMDVFNPSTKKTFDETTDTSPALANIQCNNIDTPFACTPKTVFSIGPLHSGDCTLQWATIYLLPDGHGVLQAYVSSTSSDDSWGFKNIQFSGSQSFNIGDLWSPTLPNQDPNISSNGPNWVAGFTYNGDYSQVNHIAYNYHC